MDIKIHIMIVEDDEILAKEIKSFLERWGYIGIIAGKFEDIVSEYLEYHPQLILMDINLPYFDGFHWCSKIRELSEVPIIYISSRNDDRDKIMGIAQGGDDYVEKPFHLELLKAKIDAVLRRTYQYKVREKVYVNETLFFDNNSTTLYFQNKELDLTKSEKRITAKLIEKRPDVVTREELMVELWSTDEFVSDSTLTTVICRLRNKLKTVCGDEIVKTKKGQGYYIE